QPVLGPARDVEPGRGGGIEARHALAGCETHALVFADVAVVFEIVTFEARAPSTVCPVQTKPSLGLPSDTPLWPCQPCSIASLTSRGIAQIAVPCQIQRGGG